MQPRHSTLSRQPNPAFEGTRGYALACFLGVRPPAPLNSGVRQFLGKSFGFRFAFASFGHCAPASVANLHFGFAVAGFGLR